MRNSLAGQRRSRSMTGNEAMGNAVAIGPVQPAGPVRIGLPCGSGRTRIGIETQRHKRGRAPPFPAAKAGRRLPVLPQPGHRGARDSTCIITRTGNNRNRHESGYAAPVPPPVKLRQIVGAHQPDEARLGIARLQLAQRVGSVARPQLAFDRSDPDRRPAGLPSGRGDPGRKRRHPGCRLERIARRNQPPDLVEPQRCCSEQRNAPVTAMRRIEAAPQKANARARAACQGRTCPLPRTSHL